MAINSVSVIHTKVSSRGHPGTMQGTRYITQEANSQVQSRGKQTELTLCLSMRTPPEGSAYITNGSKEGISSSAGPVAQQPMFCRKRESLSDGGCRLKACRKSDSKSSREREIMSKTSNKYVMVK